MLCLAFRQKKENIGKSVGSLKICAILRDWNRRDAEKKENYPQAPIVFVDIPLWDAEIAHQYVSERLHLHQDAQMSYDLLKDLPLCTDEERWKKNDTWAVKKKGQKRAIRVLESEHEAEKHINWHDETDTAYIKKTDLEIEFRCGEHTDVATIVQLLIFAINTKEKKMADKKTKKLMETLEKEKRKRARNKKGHFCCRRS